MKHFVSFFLHNMGRQVFQQTKTSVFHPFLVQNPSFAVSICAFLNANTDILFGPPPFFGVSVVIEGRLGNRGFCFMQVVTLARRSGATSRARTVSVLIPGGGECPTSGGDHPNFSFKNLQCFAKKNFF